VVGNLLVVERKPRRRDWAERLDDPDEPLYTIAVVAELLEVDQQIVRRLEGEGLMSTARSEGNQRRYSRRDVERLARALDLVEQGMTRTAVVRILVLEARVAELEATVVRRQRPRPGGRGR
jgi:MerR family transcriptional regulator/heat shock protein HspR